MLAGIYKALNLWHIGFADNARRCVATALAIAEAADHSHSVAMALTTLATVYQHCRDWVSSEAWASKLLAYTTQEDLAMWSAWGQLLHGTARAELGDLQGAGLIERGLAALKAIGAKAQQAEIATLPTRVRAGAIASGDALQRARDALVTARNTGELPYEAEILRMIGIFTLGDSDGRINRAAQDEAEKYFLAAAETARHQQALALELRARIELARLFIRRGQHARAHNQLAECYQQFGEGFDTADLKEARGLIEQSAR